MTQLTGVVEYTNCISADVKTPPTSVLDMIQNNDGEAPVMLELWVMRSTPSMPLLSGLLGSGVVAPDRVLSMGQIELLDMKNVYFDI